MYSSLHFPCKDESHWMFLWLTGYFWTIYNSFMRCPTKGLNVIFTDKLVQNVFMILCQPSLARQWWSESTRNASEWQDFLSLCPGCGPGFPATVKWTVTLSHCHTAGIFMVVSGVIERPRQGSLALRSRVISCDCDVRQKFKLYRINMINMIKITINVDLHPTTTRIQG